MTYNVTQNAENDFNFPIPSGADGLNNSVFTLGDVLNLSWHTQYTQMNLIQHQSGGNGTGVILASNLETTSYVWKVSAEPFDINESNVFFLWIQDAIYGGVFGSSFLNFTTTGAIESLGFTSTSSTATSQSTQSLTTQTIGSTGSPTTASQNSSSSPAAITKGSGIGTGPVAGIAVVAALLVVGLALGWYFWYQRRKRNLGGQVAPPQQYMDGKLPYQAVPHQHVEAFSKQPGYQVYRVEGQGGSPRPAEAGPYVGGEFNPNAGGIAELGNTVR